jgi:ADP-ribosylglycohydrolase
VTSAPANPRHDRVVGALLGLAVGDCLGAPLEGRAPPDQPITDFLYDQPTWTDDTQQALVWVEAVVRHGHPDPAWIAGRYLEMAQIEAGGRFGLHRGTGRGFRESVAEFARSGDPAVSGRTDRAGNGAAMRVAPIAVALSERVGAAEMARAVVRASLVTHREVRALSGALAVARLASQLAEEPGLPLARGRGTALLADLATWLQREERRLPIEHPEVVVDPTEADPGRLTDVSHLLGEIVSVLDQGWDACAGRISAMASARRGEHTWPGDGYVLASVPSAIALVLSSRDDLETTLSRAVSIGGDADTVGAMAGGLLGAACGTDAIPDRWLGFIGREVVQAWGCALATNSMEADLPDLLALETELCALVRLKRAPSGQLPTVRVVRVE